MPAPTESPPPRPSGIAALESAIRAEPDSVSAYTSLGDTYLQAARETADPAYLERADTAFAAAEGRDPGNVIATIGHGTVALAGHEFQRGLVLGREAHRAEPEPGSPLRDHHRRPDRDRPLRRGRSHAGTAW